MMSKSRGVPVVCGELSQPVSSWCRPFTALRPCSSRWLAAAVVQKGIEKHLGGPWLWSSSAGFWTSFLGFSYKSTDMVCFYIAVNTESGACTAPPERRGALQAASLVVQVNIEKCLVGRPWKDLRHLVGAMFTHLGGHMGDGSSGPGLGGWLWFHWDAVDCEQINK